MSYDSVTSNLDRLAKIKNFTMFYQDLNKNTLPQWLFITPNMTDDGHDSSVTVAGKWARGFLTPLLTNANFMKDTLVLLSKFLIKFWDNILNAQRSTKRRVTLVTIRSSQSFWATRFHPLNMVLRMALPIIITHRWLLWKRTGF